MRFEIRPVGDNTWAGVIVGVIVVLVILLRVLFGEIEGAAETIARIFRVYVPLAVSFVFLLICLIGGERGLHSRVFGLIESVLTCGAFWLFFRIVFCDQGGFLLAIERYLNGDELFYMSGIKYVVAALLVLAGYLQYFLPILLLAVVYRVFNWLSEAYGSYPMEELNRGLHSAFRIICIAGMVIGIWIVRPAYTAAGSPSEGFWAAVLGLVLYLPVSFVCRKLTPEC